MDVNVAVTSLLESIEEGISDLKNEDTRSQVDYQKCPHYFGYLANIPGDSFIPEGCIFCSKVIKCALHL